jgi:hypothetical protein
MQPCHLLSSASVGPVQLGVVCRQSLFLSFDHAD